MKLEEKIKQRYLYSPGFNLIKNLYFYIQALKSKKFIKKSYSGGAQDLIINYLLAKKRRQPWARNREASGETWRQSPTSQKASTLPFFHFHKHYNFLSIFESFWCKTFKIIWNFETNKIFKLV